MKLKHFIFVLGLTSVIGFSISSCGKKTDCTAVIYTKDSVDMPISGARVLLFANVKTATGGTITADLKADGVTDESGRVSFVFKLPAIYDIKASVGTYSGAGIVKLEEGKSVDKTITLR
jgi:hypothetical protein